MASTLKSGMYNNSEVKTLQQLLKNYGFYSGAIDGDFGPGTESAVRAFQSSRGLSVDGIVGTNTWSALNSSSSSQSSSSNSSSSSSSGPITNIRPDDSNTWNLSNWTAYSNGTWQNTPTLTVNGKQYQFATPQEYITALKQLQGEGMTGPLSQFINEFNSVTQYFQPKATTPTPQPTQSTPTPSPASQQLSWSGNLSTSTGSSNPTAVKALQNFLNSKGYNAGTADGIFGTNTANAVKAFQQANGLSADGIAGAQTLAKINSILAGTSTAAPAPTQTNTTTPTNTTTTPTTQTTTPTQTSTTPSLDSLSWITNATYAGTSLSSMNAADPAIGDLQRALNALGYNLAVDNQFGPLTTAAVKDYQQKNGLQVDGMVGKNTLASLNNSLKNISAYKAANPTTTPVNVPAGTTISTTPAGTTATNASGTKTYAPGGSTDFDESTGTYKSTGTSTPPAQATSWTGILQVGTTGQTDAVKALQKFLNDNGYNAGTVDGIYGDNTRRAVQMFQYDSGITNDGKAGPQTLDAVNKALSTGKIGTKSTVTSSSTPVNVPAGVTVTNNPTVPTNIPAGTTVNTQTGATTTALSSNYTIPLITQNNSGFGIGDNDKYAGMDGTVTKIQNILKDLGYDVGAIDGIYGAKTEAAVRAFQQANGLSVDGNFGPKSLAKATELAKAKLTTTQTQNTSTTTNPTGIVTEVPAGQTYNPATGTYSGTTGTGGVVQAPNSSTGTVSTNNGTSATTNSKPTTVANFSPAGIIKIGDRGDDVTKLQQWLSANGFPVTVDGIFGPMTQNAVKSYQQAMGLQVDGVVGTQTVGKMNSGAPIVTTTPGTPATSTYNGVDPFANLINQSPFLVEQLKDPAFKGLYDSITDPTMKMMLLQNVFALEKAIESGKVVNPNAQITPAKLDEFYKQAVAEMDPYYQQQFGVIKTDLDTSVRNLVQDFEKSAERAKVTFGQDLQDQSAKEADQGTAYSSGRNTRQINLVNTQQQAIDDAATEVDRKVSSLGGQVEAKLGTNTVRSLNLPMIGKYTATNTGLQSTGKRSLNATPYGTITVGSEEEARKRNLELRKSQLATEYLSGITKTTL